MTQQKFNFDKPIKKALFTHKRLAEAKLKYLSNNLEDLDFSEVSWLSKIEEFYREKDYITEKQISVLHGIFTKHKQQVITDF